MSKQIKTDYHDLLNRLDEMVEAPYYALAKPHLLKAQEIILFLEKENKELKLKAEVGLASEGERATL